MNLTWSAIILIFSDWACARSLSSSNIFSSWSSPLLRLKHTNIYMYLEVKFIKGIETLLSQSLVIVFLNKKNLLITILFSQQGIKFGGTFCKVLNKNTFTAAALLQHYLYFSIIKLLSIYQLL